MRSLTFLPLSLLLLASSAILAASEARAVGFDCITDNVAAQCTVGENQLSVAFSSPNATQIRFDLTNTGPSASSIQAVYIDDSGLLAGLASIVNGAGVSFAEGGTPPDLPGGNNANPDFEADFLATANNPAPTNGVNPGETLGLIFDLASGVTVAEVLAAFEGGSLRVGLHVISILGEGSESFVNVPEPSAALLMSVGLVGFSIARRRSRAATGA